MKNNVENNEVLNNKFLLGTLFLINSFFLYYFVVNCIGLITDEFNSLLVQLPKIIIYFLPSAYLVVFYKNLYYKRISKGETITFVAITSIFLVAAIILIYFNFPYFMNNYLSNYFNAYTPFDLFFLIILMIFFNVFLLSKTRKANYLDPINPGVFSIYTKKRNIFIIIMVFFASFYFAEFLISLTHTNYFKYFLVDYIMVLIYIILPLVNLIFYINLDLRKKNTVKAYSILGIFDCLYLIAFICLLEFSDVLLCARTDQAIFLGTFAVSIPISYALIALIIVSFIINIIINLFKYNKLKKD